MACSNCDGSTQLGATQGNLVAWVQPGGAGPHNQWYYAMAEGNYPALKITGASRKRRGTRTPILRRSGLNPRHSVRVGETVAAKAANTITVQFADNKCGGFSPAELFSCEFDIYQQHLCCGDGGEFETGWAKIDIFNGVDPESDDYSDQTSFVSDEDAPLTITQPAEFRDKLTVYPLNVTEIAQSVGIDTGTVVSGVAYVNKESCGDNCGGKQGCQDQFYAVTNEGRVIYKKNANSALTSNAIGSYPAFTVARIAVLGGKVFVSYLEAGVDAGFYWATLDGDGDPGAWTKVIVDANFVPQGFVHFGNKLLLYGETVTTNRAWVFEISVSTAVEEAFLSGSDDTGIVDAMECGGKIVAVGREGAIFISSCQGVWALAPSTPTASDLRRVAARTSTEWWITGPGAVYVTENSGATWDEVTFPFSGNAGNTGIVWANRNIGYVTNAVGGLISLYTTWDGGLTWVNGNAPNDRIATALAAASVSQIVIPCCSNAVEQSNSFLIAGDRGGASGGLWKAEIVQCS